MTLLWNLAQWAAFFCCQGTISTHSTSCMKVLSFRAPSQRLQQWEHWFLTSSQQPRPEKKGKVYFKAKHTTKFNIKHTETEDVPLVEFSARRFEPTTSHSWSSSLFITRPCTHHPAFRNGHRPSSWIVISRQPPTESPQDNQRTHKRHTRSTVRLQQYKYIIIMQNQFYILLVIIIV